MVGYKKTKNKINKLTKNSLSKQKKKIKSSFLISHSFLKGSRDFLLNQYILAKLAFAININ